MDAEKALEIILSGKNRTIGIWGEEHHLSSVLVVLGLTPLSAISLRKRKREDRWVTWCNILESAVDFKSEEYELTHDEGTLTERAFVLTCANVFCQHGNEAYIAPGASMDDGKMNVSILKPLNALEILPDHAAALHQEHR